RSTARTSAESSTTGASTRRAGHRSAKDVLDLLEEALVLDVLVAPARFELLRRKGVGELLEQAALFLVELLRRDGAHRDHQVAPAPAADVGQAVSAYAERGACLRALGHLQRMRAVDNRHGDLRAE